MNTLKNHFKEQLKRAGKKCIINNNICSVCFFKEIKDKEYIDTKYMFIDKDVNVNQGDIIDCLEHKWIVIQQQENYNEVYSIYVVKRINNKLNFKFGDGVYSIPVIVEDSIQSVTGVDIPLVEGKIQVITQANNITKYLVEQTRFILYNNAYQIEGYTQTEKNIIKFYCKKGQTKDNLDDLENEIPYNEKLNKIYINNKYEIAIMGDSNLDLKENESKVINIEFKKNNIIDTDPVVSYIYDKDLVKFDENTKTITAIKEGNTDLKIIYNNVEKIIKVNIQETVYNIEVTSTDIKINKGQTATIEAKFYKDNVEDTNAVVEYISNNINIATVDKNIITAIGAGQTTIVIKYKNIEKVINVAVEGGLKIIGADTQKVGKMWKWDIENPMGKEIKCTLNVDSSIAKIKQVTNTSVVILATKNDSNIGKTYIIRVELVEDKNVYDEKEITLVPLL
ncbi:Ig-like domain-containing protein [Clostridium sporogenes]|uniref:Ig-like domain-containing protein n=1 Tax=Clostridium sporogenes TaxID=1509 RepID=UPI0013C94EEE|nr:Ig-like domain-containing protein [Clostridium sporogenes]NFQ02766.1 Ig-like domain-containing protein [Clostridium sporogenes]NFQ41604.1 Ig-like domain-containing protein [Clostridium sporogenes]